MNASARGFVRRARPGIGTLVEIAVRGKGPRTSIDISIDAAFERVAALESELSRFIATSDIARFNASPAGVRVALGEAASEVLRAASDLREGSGGLFDISTGTSLCGWMIEGCEAIKLDVRARIDLGGIAKGYIVDSAVRCLIEQGAQAGWVNAGGDLRAFGDVEVPIILRCEPGGGAHHTFAALSDGAFATSRYAPDARSSLAGARQAARPQYISVAAPRCLWADALTKIVALTEDTAHPLLALHGAQAWRH